MKTTVFLVILVVLCAVNASPFSKRFLRLEGSGKMPRMMQANETANATEGANISADANATDAAAANASAAGNESAAANTSDANASAASNETEAPAAGGAFFQSSFGEGECVQCGDECNSVEGALNALNEKADSLCNIGGIPERIGNMTQQAAGMLTHIYLVNQWFYNKPYLLDIGNTEWDILNVIYPKYQHVLQQVEILKQDRDNQAICLDRYGVQNKINVLNLMHARLSNSSVANANECGLDVCSILSQDANILNQAASAITVEDRFAAVMGAIQQDLENLNNLTQAYDAIYDYINQEVSSSDNQTGSGPEVLVSFDNATKEAYASFYNNVAALVNEHKGSINSQLQAIYENTYAVPNNLWQNAEFQLPELSLASEDQMVSCATGLTQWAQEIAAQEAAIAADAARAAAGNATEGANSTEAGNSTAQ